MDEAANDQNAGIISNGLCVSYGRNQEALRNVSFTARPGAVTYMAGCNGAGKSTWIRAATGLCPKQKGDVLFGGKPFSDLSVRDRFSIVMDTPQFHLDLSAQENIRLLYGVTRTKIKDSRALLEVFQLWDGLRAKVRSFSFGKRHRLAIAAAIMRAPDFFLLDEPDVGLDAYAFEILVEELNMLKTKKNAVIIITGQNCELLCGITDNLVFLENNEVGFQGSIDDFIEQTGGGTLRAAFSIRMKREKTYASLGF